MQEFTIKEIEEKEGDYKGKPVTQYIIKTTGGNTVYSTKGKWNGAWCEGFKAQAVMNKKTSAKGHEYYVANCPEELKPQQFGGNGTGPIVPILHRIEEKLDRIEALLKPKSDEVFPKGEAYEEELPPVDSYNNDPSDGLPF